MKDVIKSGGEWISSLQIEELIEQYTRASGRPRPDWRYYLGRSSVEPDTSMPTPPTLRFSVGTLEGRGMKPRAEAVDEAMQGLRSQRVCEL